MGSRRGLRLTPFGVILWGCLTKKKPCSADALLRALLFPSLTSRKLVDGLKIIKPCCFATRLFLCSGGRIRTSDLWVMSPTSYHCSTPQYVFKKTFRTSVRQSADMSPTSAENQQALLALIFEHPRKTSQIKDLRFSGLPLLHPAICFGCKFNITHSISKIYPIYYLYN